MSAPPCCPICTRPVPQRATGRPRTYCSRACQAKGYRARAAAAQTPARARAPGEPGTPLRTHMDAVLLAASVLSRAPTDSAAAAHLAGAARDLAAWADSITAPVALVREVRESEPAASPARIPSRDETGRPKRTRHRRRAADVPARDETAPTAAGEPPSIQARPQRMPRTRATAVADAARLERVPGTERRSPRRVLRSGETVLGYVEPAYGGASRSGRTGWVGLLPGEHTGRPLPTREAATESLTRRWVELVTSAPPRTRD